MLGSNMLEDQICLRRLLQRADSDPNVTRPNWRVKRVVGENQDVTVAIPLALIARIWDWHASTGLLWPSWKGKSVTAWPTYAANATTHHMF